MPDESNSLRLAFGDGGAFVERDPDMFAQKFNQYHPRLDSFEVKGDRRAFTSKYSKVMLPELTAIAFTRSPMLIERVDIPDFTLWLPTFGTATIGSGRQTISVGCGIGFALDTTRRRVIEGEHVGGVLFKLDRRRLSEVIETMAGGRPLTGRPLPSTKPVCFASISPPSATRTRYRVPLRIPPG